MRRMGDRKDPLRLLEAAYSFEKNEGDWVRGIVAAAKPFGLGQGVGSYITELGDTLRYRSPVLDSAYFDESIFDAFNALPPWLCRRVHQPTPTRNALEYARAAARAEGISIDAVAEAAEVRNPGETWGVIGGDAGRESILIMFPCKGRQGLSASTRRVLDCVGAHLGAALRLRSHLRTAPSPDDDDVDAVLTPSGRVLDARGAAAQAGAATLTDAVRNVERARTRKADPDERLALWTALVDGRWSIVESTERDGKRTLLACKNEPRAAGLRKLSGREKSVAGYAALGHPFKYIAYELGISVPTVSACLKRALRKLGLASRAELIRTFGQ
jgi:DNA-binding CsgD family transcriptional regulator